MKNSALIVLLALGLAGLAAASTPKTVVDVVVANKKDFSILLAAVQAADPAILAALNDPKAGLTVFAPTDKAFKRLLKQLKISAEDLLKNKTLLTNVLKYHVLGVPVPSSALKIRQTVETLLGGKNGKLKITKKLRHGAYVVRLYTTSGGTAKVIKPDIKVGKSYIHVINRVLIPK